MRTKQFVQVAGSPAGEVGNILIIQDGGEYVVEEVQVVTQYQLRDVTPAEALAISHRVPVMNDEIRLVNLRGDRRSHGVQMALRAMERDRVVRKKREEKHRRK